MQTTTEDPVDPLVGRLLDERYRLDALIARGGMAAVFVATDTRLDRVVAVKVMHRALADDPDFVARFTREARASARLSCAEVVAIHDQGTDPSTGLAYLVMEHVQGRNLRQVLRERGALTPARALDLVEPVLVALAAAHAAGLVHRDIKPENVLLADDGRVKVADFGLARAVEASELTATTGLLIGTVAYLAPEQVESGRADARTDVYAVGVLLWELLTGGQPYTGETPLSVALQHLRKQVPAPSTAVAGLTPALDALVVRATRPEPAERYADAAAMLAGLRAVRAGLPAGPARHDDQRTLVVALPPAEASTTPVPTVPAAGTPAPGTPTAGTSVPGTPTAGTPVPGTARPRRRRRGRVLLAVLVVLALLAAGGGYYLGAGRSTTTPAVLGLDKARARAAVEKAGLTVRLGRAAYSEALAAGIVLAQTPRPGGRIARHATVTLVFSLGPDRRVVPGVAGSSEPAARAALAAVGLAYRSTTGEYSRTVATGVVLRSDPAAGARLKPGTPVDLVVSKGPRPVAVPDERGKPGAAATAALTGVGFVVTTSSVFSDTVAKGTVVDQSPSSGTADLGGTVSLVVSKGPDVVVVPKVVGLGTDAAVAQLKAAGLKARVLAFPGGPGQVLKEDPGAGRTVRRGTTVTLYAF